MATKNIAISEQAYQRLRALKKPGEGFTDAVEGITRNRSISELARVLSNGDGRDLKQRVKEIMEQSSHRIYQTAERPS